MTHLTTDQPVDPGLLGQAFPNVTIERLGADPVTPEDTAYIVDADVTLEELAEAVANAEPAETGRDLLLNAEAAFLAVAAGQQSWDSIPDPVKGALGVLACHVLRAPVAMWVVDNNRPCEPLREMVERRKAQREG